MAQDGDTITYTFSGAKETEDISAIDEITIQSMEGADGADADADGGSGGLIQSATADVSSYNTLDIWVGGVGDSDDGGFGRSNGGDGQSTIQSGGGGGSTELWTDADSIFIAATDGGGGSEASPPFLPSEDGGGGGAGGTGFNNGEAIDCGNERTNCAGGDGGTQNSISGEPGGQELGIASGGTLSTGGSTAGNGEITLEFKQLNAAPSIDEASATPTDGAAGVSVDPTLSIDVSDADGQDVDVTFIDESDDTQIGTTQTVTGGSGTTSVVWSGRGFNTTYQWSVEATDGTATTTSATFSFTTTALAAPSNVQITDSETEDQLTLNWDTVSGAAGYYVYRAEASGSTKADYTQIADVSAAPYTDTGLEDGERYYYRVSSHD